MEKLRHGTMRSILGVTLKQNFSHRKATALQSLQEKLRNTLKNPSKNKLDGKVQKSQPLGEKYGHFYSHLGKNKTKQMRNSPVKTDWRTPTKPSFHFVLYDF